MLTGEEMDMIKQEFGDLLGKPHVTWNKMGMIYQLQLALTNVLLKQIEKSKKEGTK